MDQARRQSDVALLNKDLDIQTRLRFTSDCIPNEDRDVSNVDAIKYHYGEILKMIGENPEREGAYCLFVCLFVCFIYLVLKHTLQGLVKDLSKLVM